MLQGTRTQTYTQLLVAVLCASGRICVVPPTASAPLPASVLYAERSPGLQRLEMQQKAQMSRLHVTTGPVQSHEPHSALLMLMLLCSDSSKAKG